MEKQIGTLKLMSATTTTGKKMLAGFRQDGTRLLMDITNDVIPDGQTAYMFDNKLIITVHWAGFTEDDYKAVFNNTIKLRMGMMESGACIFVKFGDYVWGDVLTLPGLMGSFNDPNSLFTDVVFVFIDSQTGMVLGMREIPLIEEVGAFLGYANATSYIFFEDSGYKKSSYRVVSELHDDWCKAAASDLATARNIDFEAMSEAKGIYCINIDENDFAKFYIKT